MNYSIYAESTPNPEVMKFVSNRMLADKSLEILKPTIEIPIKRII